MYNTAILFPKEDKRVPNHFCIKQFVFFSIRKKIKEALFVIVAVSDEAWQHVDSVLNLVYLHIARVFLMIFVLGMFVVQFVALFVFGDVAECLGVFATKLED